MALRVLCTEAAASLIEKLKKRHGPLMFHQSGGCCDRSAPMWLPQGDFRTGPADSLLGEIAGCPFWMGAQQFEYRAHTQLTIDRVPGPGTGFSVEAPEGTRFLTRSRLFTDDEVAELERASTPV